MSSPESATTNANTRALTRRQFLATTAGGLAGLGTLGAASGTASAATTVERFASEKPNHVTIQTDQEWLDTYRPLLDLSAVKPANHPTLRGWRVSSPDRDTEVGVFAAEYAVQRDVWTLTSHAGDHEWIYVFVNRSDGSVSAASYSAYHWLRGYVTDPSVHEPDDGGRHVMFSVAPTYHNHIPMASEGNGVLLDVETLGDYETRTGTFYSWLKNGMGEDLEPGAVHDPWRLSPDGTLDAWWSEDSARINRYLVNTWAFIGFTVGVGFRGSEDASLGDANL